MKNRTALFAVAALATIAGSALARPLMPGDINGVFEVPYLFADRPDSNLVLTNNFPASYRIQEDQFGNGGFANRHTAYFSTNGGASAYDFNYDDGFDLCTTVTYSYSNVNSEAGFQSDLFGLGIFGVLPNGEIASFGSILPFHSFGMVLPANFQGTVGLRMRHTPGTGDGVNPLPMGGTPSYIEYFYDIGGGWVSSGAVAFGGTEGGIPSNFTMLIGVGTQNNLADPILGTSDILFEDIKTLPAPGALALTGLAGLVGLRRRR